MRKDLSVWGGLFLFWGYFGGTREKEKTENPFVMGFSGLYGGGGWFNLS